MAISERSGADVMTDLDIHFCEVLARFRQLAEASGGRYQVEYDAEMRPVAIICDAERYPIERLNSN